MKDGRPGRRMVRVDSPVCGLPCPSIGPATCSIDPERQARRLMRQLDRSPPATRMATVPVYGQAHLPHSVSTTGIKSVIGAPTSPRSRLYRGTWTARDLALGGQRESVGPLILRVRYGIIIPHDWKTNHDASDRHPAGDDCEEQNPAVAPGKGNRRRQGQPAAIRARRNQPTAGHGRQAARVLRPESRSTSKTKRHLNGVTRQGEWIFLFWDFPRMR